MSEQAANPDTGALTPEIQPMSVNDAAAAFRTIREGGQPLVEDLPEEPSPDESPRPDAEAEGEAPELELPDENTESEPEAEAKAPTAPERYTVKINGDERKVTLEELKKGYQLEADYRQKTAQLAEQRRAMDAERQQYKAQLDQLVPVLTAAAQDKWAKVDWQGLAKADPAKYVELQAEYHADMNRLAVAQAEHRKVQEAAQKEQAEKVREHIERQNSLLVEKIPALKDAEKGKAIKKAVADYLVSEGFTTQELETLSDHRAFVIAHKAHLYDKAVKAKNAATAKAAPAKPVAKPGPSRPANTKAEQAAAAINRLKKTGSVNDAAQAFRAAGIFR